MPADEQGTNVPVGTGARKNHLFDGLSPFTDCKIPSVSTLYLYMVDEGDLCRVDDGIKTPTACSWTPQFPSCFSKASHRPKMFFFFVASLLKCKKLQPSPSKLAVHVCPEANGRNLCVEDGGWVGPARFPKPQPVSRTPQLPPRFSKASHTAKTLFFLAACQLKVKKLNAFHEDNQFLKYSTVVMWRAWFHVLPSKKSTKSFFSWATRLSNWRTSQHNSPGEAFQVDESGVPLWCPLAETSEVTSTRTDRQTQNTSF